MKYQTLAVMLVFEMSCAIDGDVETRETGQEVNSDNGTSLNGTSLNGTSLNGTSLNGTSLNGTSLNGTSLNGTSLNGTSLNGTSLNGTSLTGSTWTGTLFLGTTAPASSNAGSPAASTIELRIDSATQGTGTNSDVGLYAVAYRTTAGWNPLCGLDALGAPILAIAVPGTWNLLAGVPGSGAYTASTTAFTFACRGKTVAKCIELGYKTWTGRSNQLAACVRLLRADYCGNGISHTADGTLLNLYDNVGVQADTQNWTIEAEWTPAGARCVTANKNTRIMQQLGAALPCAISTSLAKCGTSFAAGAVLIDELAPL